MTDGPPRPRRPTVAGLPPLLDLGTVLLLVARPDGSVVYANPRYRQVMEERTDVSGDRPWWQGLVPPSEEPRLRAAFAAAVEGVDPATMLSHWHDAGGGVRTVTWSAIPVARGDGGTATIDYVVVTGVDLSEARSVREQVLDREARLRAILDTAVDGIITIDDGGVIESVNAAAERIFGYPAQEMVGRNVRLLMPDPWRSHHDEYIAAYLRSGERRIIGIGREVEGRRKDGSTFPMDLAVSEMFLAGGRLFTGIVRDVSARRRTEQEARRRLEELAHASRISTVGEMATALAHEVNQPLAAIVSFSHACLRMLRAGGAEPAVLQDALEQIAAQGQRAGRIIHHLRQFLRKEESVREQVDVNATLRGLIELLRHDLQRRGVTLEADLASRLPMVSAHRVQIEQVALNLVRNALESMETDPDGAQELRLATRRDEHGSIEISVADRGEGLPEGDPERVFERFYTTKSSGMGVGLPISRSIIELHGGRLWAESRAGGGAVFRFTLPVPPATGEPG
jgi:two-component system, LuxR family, sensor kinase FixL